ncbi:alpha/beta fold hydrolase [Actinomycetospora cinnamomea]|uniref:Alpha/beta hydrolase family protein n=1 Tax=Actinomycetospora cinnamomea TaxID=663609 RepID=A0A2U1EC65_9PSEU|nr:alpha/beta fold hydrolase [Actinomycetospora cinnamomea]PVY97510.1 alpha/beta hydrolase family protein [Actinomycetospora cinnamomea]
MSALASASGHAPAPVAAPPWATTPPTTGRRGYFWVPGERVSDTAGVVRQKGPMFVSWEAPAQDTGRLPVVLVHGGGAQATDWWDTPDGRPGWAAGFLAAGHPVLTVDRPGHGRSPAHPDVVGAPGPQFDYGTCRVLFTPDRPDHTRWPLDRDDEAAADRLMAPLGALPADLAESQRLDADRLAGLLDAVGPAIVVTHSAGGPAGWLLADRRPGLVRALVAVEPIGPAFADFPGIGTLDWGLTAAPLTYDPPRASAADARAADPATLRVPGLAGLPVALVTGGASMFADFADDVVASLATAGADVERVHLPDHGVTGNGHALIYETNSDEALAVVLRWLDARDPAPGPVALEES